MQIFFAMICYYIAKFQNRNSNIAILSGFIFGIIAVIVYLFLEENKDSNQTETLDLGEDVPDDIDLDCDSEE